MSFWQWLVQAYGFPDLICQNQDLKGNIAWVPEVDVVVGLGSLQYTRKMVIPLWLDWVQFCSWLIPGSGICPNWWGPSHKVSAVLVSNTHGKLPVFHYSGGGREQRKFLSI